ncbi:MAG TPA: haloacid dehalogenase, partial [Candidatus Dormibacteraeota bacterium]|nr:haloacid dehalogenase [Candidatus Dormibacteraeota bacterium]
MTAERDPDLATVIDRTETMLLDFDGPICSIFAGMPASSVAGHLRKLLLAEGLSLPEHLTGEDDPIEVLRFTSTLGPATSKRIESALRSAEVAATRSAEPTPHAREVMLACRQTNRAVAVISNNSKA